MSSLNKVMLIGNCGRDPEIRYLQSGAAVCNVSIATSTKRKDKQSGETIEDTEWHRITLYERLAEIAGEYVKKGSKIYVEGRIKSGKYTDKDGVERTSYDIVASNLTLLSGREDGGQQSDRGAPRQQGQGQQRQQAPQRGEQPQRGAQQQRQAPQRQAPAQGGHSGFDDMDDDIPF